MYFAWGSSPLTRGIRAAVRSAFKIFRFIPAHAGNTGTADRKAESPEVHPRSRGEYIVDSKGNVTGGGSSPLTRGIQWLGFDGSRTHGFIPAHAGNTREQPEITKTQKVHPRSRGEYRRRWYIPVVLSGSSPLTRGIRNMDYCRNCSRRFIPAHAGNTLARKPCLSGWTVHPRSRGEYAGSFLVLSDIPGSSPLTRGIQVRQAENHHVAGFIPAHAGNTFQLVVYNLSAEVHPRSRGEYCDKSYIADTARGSSPLTRGILNITQLAFAFLGFIPAHAGNTCLS